MTGKDKTEPATEIEDLVELFLEEGSADVEGFIQRREDGGAAVGGLLQDCCSLRIESHVGFQ